MRIIAGRAGRTRLDVPRDTTRPTTDRVREALFSILGASVEGARVLDLFAGSGALGLEALSRGAREAVFVDESQGACRAIEQNLERARLEGGTIWKGKARVFLKKTAAAGEAYDLIFADPPYRKKSGDSDYVAELFGDADLPRVIRPEGRLVMEMSEAEALPPSGEWEVVDDRRYGGTRIVILARTIGL